MQERCGSEFPVDHHVLRKALAHTIDDPPQEALPGGIFTIAGPVGFHIAGQGKTGAYHTDQNQGMLIAEDLFLGIALRTTERAARLGAPSGTRAVDR